MQTLRVTKADDGGYIVTAPLGRTEVFHTLDAVFAYLLRRFEGLAPGLGGDSHGSVKILRGHELLPTVVKDIPSPWPGSEWE